MARSIFKELDKRKQLIFGDGTLQKAYLKYQKDEKEVELPVQFNPSEYSISRQVEHKDEKGIAKDAVPEDTQSTGSKLADLSVKLIFDTSTELPDYVIDPALKEKIDTDNELADICQELAMLTKVNPQEHIQSNISFVWGKMEFVGYLNSLNIHYQMFNRNGYPVRVEMDLSIRGEEKDISTAIESKPKESPDRTKYRTLGQNDQLWMLAAEEYQDVSEWKEIARANGILNPRKIDHTKGLKIPAL